jgi:hypothetical protein
MILSSTIRPQSITPLDTRSDGLAGETVPLKRDSAGDNNPILYSGESWVCILLIYTRAHGPTKDPAVYVGTCILKNIK